MKTIYEKPSMEVIRLQDLNHTLAGSGDPIPPPGVPWWDGEADAKRCGGWFGDEEDTEEAWSVIP